MASSEGVHPDTLSVNNFFEKLNDTLPFGLVTSSEQMKSKIMQILKEQPFYAILLAIHLTCREEKKDENVRFLLSSRDEMDGDFDLTEMSMYTCNGITPTKLIQNLIESSSEYERDLKEKLNGIKNNMIIAIIRPKEGGRRRKSRCRRRQSRKKTTSSSRHQRRRNRHKGFNLF